MTPDLEPSRSDEEAAVAAATWTDLTARSVALCKKDPVRWRACADRSDQSEAAGVDPLTAVRRALEEFGA